MNKTVLLVEDERRLREIVSDYFRNEGFEVIEAEDGKKALELFAEHEIDLIMLDIMLPEIDGWSVCRRIRKESAVPIIMLTARSDEDDTLLGFELGADEYVTKPFSPKVLVGSREDVTETCGWRGRSSRRKCYVFSWNRSESSI